LRIDVRLGSGLARLAGASRVRLEVDEGATVDDVLEALADDRPAVASWLTSALTVVGGSQVGGERVLGEGEEVAVLAPVGRL
jgi:molybdopterin converting factor small subunit